MDNRTIRLSDAIEAAVNAITCGGLGVRGFEQIAADDVRKALSALPAVGGWLDIEQYDGPPDGLVWGFSPDAPEYRRHATVRFKEGKIWTVGSVFHFDSDPVTHYMPLPAPPIE